jgi:hypothetical protein
MAFSRGERLCRVDSDRKMGTGARHLKMPDGYRFDNRSLLWALISRPRTVDSACHRIQIRDEVSGSG